MEDEILRPQKRQMENVDEIETNLTGGGKPVKGDAEN